MKRKIKNPGLQTVSGKLFGKNTQKPFKTKQK